MVNKKGAAVWVSAVLYFGLGIILLTLILSAGLPTINKIRDKNVISQTKEVFHSMDAAIREVVRQGPGSQRVLHVELKRGAFNLDAQNEIITWNYTSKVAISEPGNSVSEGNLKLLTEESVEEGSYDITLTLCYFISTVEPCNNAKKIADFKFTGVQTIEGVSSLTIKNEGICNQEKINANECQRDRLPIIVVSET